MALRDGKSSEVQKSRRKIGDVRWSGKCGLARIWQTQDVVFLSPQTDRGGRHGRERRSPRHSPQYLTDRMINTASIHFMQGMRGNGGKLCDFAATPAVAEDEEGWTVATFMPSEGDEERHGSGQPAYWTWWAGRSLANTDRAFPGGWLEAPSLHDRLPGGTSELCKGTTVQMLQPAHLKFTYTDASYRAPTSLVHMISSHASSMEEVPWSRHSRTKTEYQITLIKAVQVHHALH